MPTISTYQLPEIFWNIETAACTLLWWQGKVPGSIYFTHDKVATIDFQNSGHRLILAPKFTTLLWLWCYSDK